MPRVEIPVTQLTDSGVAPPAQTNADATNDHYIAGNDGHIMLEIISTDGGAQSVTILTPGTFGGLNLEDRTVSVPAGQTRYVGRLAPGIYNQADGSIYLDPSVSTNLKFRAYRVS